MTAVDIFKASRMKQIEDTTVVSGLVGPDGHLLLSTRVGEEIDAGYVKGDPGEPGEPGEPGPPGEDGIAGSTATPAGTITLWASDTAPANWLICDGSAVSRTDYPSLFEAIGIKYGAGDGVNTFNLPNLKGRTPIGKDSAQTEFNDLAKIGGEKAHLLTAAESGLPAHNHVQDPHFHQVGASSAANGTADVLLNQESSTPTHAGWSVALQAAAAGLRRLVATTNTASNKPNAAENATQAHNILQPYTVVNFIIKVTNGDTPGDSQLTDRVSELEANFSATPAGTMALWPSDIAPTNWLLCDGTAVSRTTYASLFAAVGTKYGAGNGSTTFNLPNLKGRVPVGRDAAQAEFDTLGETGGAKTHTLTVAEMPAHGHNVQGGTNGYTGGIAGGLFFSNNPPSHAGYTGLINNTGGGGAHNNLQPYQVVNYIIKFTNGDTKGDSQLTQRVSDIESGTAASVRLRDKTRLLQHLMSGGGVRKGNSTSGIAWSEKFRLAGSSRDELVAPGYYNVEMPPDGTIIPVYGHPTITSVTVSGGYISFTGLGGYSALYYDIPYGSTSFVSDPTRFKIVDHSATPTILVQPSWLLVCQQNADGLSADYKWGDGKYSDRWRPISLISGWGNYDPAGVPTTSNNNYATPAWRFGDDGKINLRGLIGAGTAANITNSIPAVLAPNNRQIFMAICNAGFARVDVFTGTSSTEIVIMGYMAGGTNMWLDLCQTSWFPKDAY